MKNIKILGAGLSGLSAAINLAKVGYNVDVFEKRSDCGGRFKDDLEGLENWSSNIDVLGELKSMNIRINFDCTPYKIMYLSDGKDKIKIVSKLITWIIESLFAKRNNTKIEIVSSKAPTIFNK